MVRLTDEEIKEAKSEAERLSRTFKVHPRFEEEKYLLDTQLKKVYTWLRDNYSDDITLPAWEEIENTLLKELGE